MISRCYGVPDAASQTATTRLIGAWKLKKEGKRLQRMIASARAAPVVRRAAATALGEVGGRGSRDFLVKLADASRPIESRYLGAIGLAAGDLRRAAPHAASVLSADPKSNDPSLVITAFLSRKGGADLLAVALASTAPHADVARRARQHFIETGQQHPGLLKAFGGGVARGSLEDQLVQENAKRLGAEVREHGDPARGELIFRRKSLACTTCHAIGKAGRVLGPDLAAIGSSSPPDYLVDSLLRPSKVIKEFYESATIVTEDGVIINGLLAFQGEKEVVLRDASQQGKLVRIPRSNIADMASSKISLMPTGLANKLKDRQEFLDLVCFISDLGRPGPYATSVAQVVRRWRIRHASGKLSEVDAATFGDAASWKEPAYSMVSGLLPSADLRGEGALTLVRGEVDVTTAGKVRLSINSTKGLRLWVDGRPVAARVDVVVELASGRRALTFAIDRRQRGDNGLRVELTDAPGSSASYQVVGGP